MELIRRASESEVIQYWLKREYETRDWVKKGLDRVYGDSIHLIDLEDFENLSSNAIRFRMLQACRPFIPHFQKGGMSEIEEWNLARLHGDDLPRLVLINAGDRREMSGGTLKPLDAAKRIEEGTAFVREDVRQDADYIRNNAEKLATDSSRIVVIGPRNASLTVVDGVHRITALCLQCFVRKTGKFSSIEAYHGLSQRIYNHPFQ